eukprot:557796-Rhodomonas_salina.2
MVLRVGVYLSPSLEFADHYAFRGSLAYLAFYAALLPSFPCSTYLELPMPSYLELPMPSYLELPMPSYLASYALPPRALYALLPSFLCST